MSLTGLPNPMWAFPYRMNVIAAAAYETVMFNRVSIPREGHGLIYAGTTVISALLASLPAGLSTVQRMFLFRSYFLLGTALFLIGIAAWRTIKPVLQCRRHRICLIGEAAWVGCLAVAGTFVPGGLGYKILPFTIETWSVVNIASYWALMAVISVMTAAMVAKGPGRKRAAKTRAGRTVTGLIEIERAA